MFGVLIQVPVISNVGVAPPMDVAVKTGDRSTHHVDAGFFTIKVNQVATMLPELLAGIAFTPNVT